MFDHLSFGVQDLARAAKFYDAFFAPFGVLRVWSKADAIGYGRPGPEDTFALKQRPLEDGNASPRAGLHVAFSAKSRLMVEVVHAAALLHGGSDEGAPGYRPHYGPGYFAAFVRDPDGYLLEIVVHERV